MISNEVKAARMSIGEASLLTRLSSRAIRLYETQGLVKPDRALNGNRLFTGRDVERLQLIALARRMGVSLKEAARLLKILEDRGSKAAEAALKAACEARLEQLEAQQHELRVFLTRPSLAA